MAGQEWKKSYNAEDNDELRKLQLTILEILKIFKVICEKHHLRYFMVGGTMLGAARHKGFIPWDDDLDVGMPRRDYEKFLRIVKKELPDGYDFLNYKMTSDYHRYFSRIVDKKVEIYNASNTKEIIENAWLDIFPYDGMPKGKVAQKIHFWYLTGWRLLYHASCFDELVNLKRPGRPAYQQAIINFLYVTKLGRRLNTKRIMWHIERGLRKYDYDHSDTLVSFFGAYVTREIIPKSMLGKLPYYPFEDIRLRGAEHADAFLTHFYGDWRKPPADGQKDKHNIKKIVYKNKDTAATDFN